MLKKTIKYEDYNGNEVSEDFYFNLSKTEILKWQMSVDGGMTEVLKKMVNERSSSMLMEYFSQIISMSYGEKSPDGKRFIKSKELTDSFIQTPAYDALFMELFSDSAKAAEFINGVIPKNLADEVERMQKEGFNPLANG